MSGKSGKSIGLIVDIIIFVFVFLVYDVFIYVVSYFAFGEMITIFGLPLETGTLTAFAGITAFLFLESVFFRKYSFRLKGGAFSASMYISILLTAFIVIYGAVYSSSGDTLLVFGTSLSSDTISFFLALAIVIVAESCFRKRKKKPA